MEFEVQLQRSAAGRVGLSLASQGSTLEVAGFTREGARVGPAETCGRLCKGDVLVSADGISVVGRSLPEVVPMLKGAPHSLIRLRFYRKSASRATSQGRYMEGPWPGRGARV